MASVGKVELVITLENGALVAKTAETNAALASVGRTAEAAGSQAGNSFDRMAMGMARSASQAQNSTQGLAYSVMEARHAVMGMGEEMGVRIPLFVSTFVAHIGGLGPVLAAAFAPVAIIGMVEVLGQIPVVFDKIIGSITGWDAEAKKAYEHFGEENHKAVDDLEAFRRKQEGIGMIGLTGAAKTAGQQGNVDEDIRRATERATQLQRANITLQQELKNSHNWFMQGIKEGGDFFFADAQVSMRSRGDISKEIAQNVKDAQALAKELTNLRGIEVPTLAAEAGAEVMKEEAARLAKWASAYDAMNARLVDSIKKTSPYLRQIDALAKVEGQFMLDEIRKTSPELERQAIAQEMQDAAATSRRASQGLEVQQSIDIASYETKIAEEQAKKIQQGYKTTFDTLKHEAGGVFDALLHKASSVWAAIGNSLKTALLTAVKDVVTSRIAAALMEMFMNVHVSMAKGGKGLGGILGGMFGVGNEPVFSGGKMEQPNHLGDMNLVNGAVPVVMLESHEQRIKRVADSSNLGSVAAPLAVVGGGATALAGSGTPAGMVSSAINWGRGAISTGAGMLSPGSPGTLASSIGAIGPGGSTAGGGLGGVLGSIGKLFGFGGGAGSSGGKGLGGILGNLKGMIGLGGEPTFDPATGLSPNTPFGQLPLGSQAMDIAKSPAGMIGGGLLLSAGMDRSGFGKGVGGVFESAAGGALLGAQFGPIGMAVGAIAGGIAGTISALIPTALAQVRQQVKDTYSIDLGNNTGIAQQILDVARQNFGGSISTAIRSPQIRDMLFLFAQTVPQPGVHGLRPPMVGAGFQESAAGLFSLPAYQNGIQQGSLGRIGPGTASNAGATSITIPITSTLDGKVLASHVVSVVTQNGRAVSAAVVSGQKASVGRRSQAIMQMSPGLITS